MTTFSPPPASAASASQCPLALTSGASRLSDMCSGLRFARCSTPRSAPPRRRRGLTASLARTPGTPARCSRRLASAWGPAAPAVVRARSARIPLPSLSTLEIVIGIDKVRAVDLPLGPEVLRRAQQRPADLTRRAHPHGCCGNRPRLSERRSANRPATASRLRASARDEAAGVDGTGPQDRRDELLNIAIDDQQRMVHGLAVVAVGGRRFLPACRASDRQTRVSEMPLRVGRVQATRPDARRLSALKPLVNNPS